MQVLIPLKDYDNNSAIISACESALPGYRSYENNKHYFQADGDVLRQIFVSDPDGDRTIEWTVSSISVSGFGGKKSVVLVS